MSDENIGKLQKSCVFELAHCTKSDWYLIVCEKDVTTV